MDVDEAAGVSGGTLTDCFLSVSVGSSISLSRVDEARGLFVVVVLVVVVVEVRVVLAVVGIVVVVVVVGVVAVVVVFFSLSEL
jgi:hypothetical protein